MLIYLDNAALDRSELASPASTAAAGSTRTSRAKSWSCIRSACARVYTQDDVTSFAKVLTGWTIIPTAAGSGARRRVHVQSAHARAGPADGDRQELRRRRRRAGPRRAGRSRAPSGDREAHRAQARAPFRRRRAAARAGRAAGASASSTPTATSRKSPRRWSRRPKPGTRRAPSSSVRANGSWPRCARPASSPPTSGRMMQRAEPARRAAVAAAGAQGLFRRRRAPGSTAWRSGSTSPTSSRAAVADARRSAWRWSSSARRRSRRDETRQTIARAESRPQALALLLMSPEFQRR